MENQTVYELRSRSRSNTPFLRSSCDREHCTGEGVDHIHVSGRRTPSKRDTPAKQANSISTRKPSYPILEVDEDGASPHPYQTRQVSRSVVETLHTTGDSPDRLGSLGYKEIAQNKINSRFESERATSTTTARTFADVSLSPINTAHTSYNVSGERSRYSPSYSACSTDSLFAEQALQDASALLELDPEHSPDHLPSRLYKLSGEYWNKYPKTDYTYSTVSKDRVELAPGQVAMPNMSRRSLQHFATFGPNTSLDGMDELISQNSWTSSVRQRMKTGDTSDDEDGTDGYKKKGPQQRFWLTAWFLSIITTITSTVTEAYRSVVGPPHRYPYTNLPPKQGALSKAGGLLAAPFVFIYSFIKKVFTSTITTIEETITAPPSVHKYTQYNNYSVRSVAAPVNSSRRWWWLLLIPLVGYACYYSYPELLLKYQNLETQTPNYESPKIELDSDLTNRLKSLEGWALSVDSKLKYFDQKMTKLDGLEAQIEQFSIKYLKQNLIQLLMINTENTDVLGEKLKEYFDNYYVGKDEVGKISLGVYEKLIKDWKPDLDEDAVRKIVEEYLSSFEKKQLEIIMAKVLSYVKEVEVQKVEVGFDAEAVKKIVAGMLEIYDADKTGLVDYALESAGGQVISTRCTELYQVKTKQYSILGIPLWMYTSPRNALAPGAMPAECWAFQGFPGYLVVKTYAIIEVTGFSIEHMSKLLAMDAKIESAPKNFSVYGLRDEMDTDPHLFGDYMYDENGTSIQYFRVKNPKTENIGEVEYPVAYNIIELRIETNYGNPTYTCLYRFRVHGNPLSDIRKATEDSMKVGT